MQMRRNWQEGSAGGKAKKSYPPRAACWGPSDKLSRRVRQPQQLRTAPGDWQSLGSTPHPHAASRSPRIPHPAPLIPHPAPLIPHPASRIPLRGPGGARDGSGLKGHPGASCTRHRNTAGKGTRTAADLEPLCKFTRGYGKTNTEEPGESGGGG